MHGSSLCYEWWRILHVYASKDSRLCCCVNESLLSCLWVNESLELFMSRLCGSTSRSLGFVWGSINRWAIFVNYSRKFNTTFYGFDMQANSSSDEVGIRSIIEGSTFLELFEHPHSILSLSSSRLHARVLVIDSQTTQ